MKKSDVKKTFHGQPVEKMDNFGIGLLTYQYGWTCIKEPHKRVILVNLPDCKNRICVSRLAYDWTGDELKYNDCIGILLAQQFVNIIKASIEKDEPVADVTWLFEHDIYAAGQTMPQAEVYELLMHWFDIVSETPNVLEVNFRID